MRIPIIIILFFVGLLTTSRAQGYGLLFKSTEVGIESRTGLNLTYEEAIKFDKRVTLAFDLSFRHNPIHFGTIFQLKDNTAGKSLAFNCNMFEEGSELVFTLNGRPTGLMAKMPVAMKELYNRWHHMEVTLDAENSLLQLTIDSVYTYTSTFTFPLQTDLSIIFGVDQNNKQLIPESPYFSLKDVIIKDAAEQAVYHWPLQQANGNTSKDVIHEKMAFVYNPEWVMNYHQNWQALETLELESGGQVAFSPELQMIFFLYSDFYYTYDLMTRQMEKRLFDGPSPIGKAHTQNVLCQGTDVWVYNHMAPFVSRFDLVSRQWDTIDVATDIPTAYHHHNKLIHPITKNITTIAGYGYFKYNNRIQSFNPSAKNWETLNLTGDTISPRYLAALGRGDATSWYLFGGIGNEDGNQLLGQEHSYDLYRIDFDRNQIKRIWDIPVSEMKQSFTPVNSLVMNTDKDCFYTLVFDQHDYHTSLHLLKGGLTQPDLQLIGDSIPYYFKDVDSYADLFYWEGANQLLALTLHNRKDDKADIGLYTLLFPPMDGQLETLPQQSGTKLWWVIVPVMALMVVVIMGLFRRKKRKHEPVGVPESVVPAAVPEEIVYSTRNRINLFGGFQVINRDGKDITDRFSPTVKELFLLVFTHSVKGKDGISSNGIHKIVWPDKDEVRAKNNRGVNVGRLRAALSELDGISLDYNQAKWRINYEQDVFIDFNTVKEIINKGAVKADPVVSVARLLPLLNRGKLLSCSNKEWLSIFKEQETALVIEVLEQLLQSDALRQGSEQQVALAEVIFKFDQLNDTALRYYCRIFHQKGKHGIAWEAFQRFTSQYRETYNEEYPVDFKALIK